MSLKENGCQHFGDIDYNIFNTKLTTSNSNHILMSAVYEITN